MDNRAITHIDCFAGPGGICTGLAAAGFDTKVAIDGGSEEFPENGWHGMYVLSEIEEDNRLYHSGFDLDVFTKHAIKAAEYWRTQRQWFNQEWKA